MSDETKRLGIFLSFKKSEETLLNDIKSIKNYSSVIKELMQLYIQNGNKMPVFDDRNTQTTSNTLTVTFDDICKLVASVNVAPVIANEVKEVKEESNKSEHTDMTISSKEKQNEDLDADDMDAFN